MSPDAHRRLAAVWFADIVGYTSLSSRDEDGALRVVRAFQELTEGTVAEHGGRVVKYIGDGALAEFSSTDGALRAALTLLADFDAHDEVRPFGSTLRIGVHVGEVVGAEDGDIYGDGVNLAARLQGQAAPGRVFVSSAVYEQIKQRPALQSRPVGERHIKGIGEPVSVYEVAFAGALPSALPSRPADRPAATQPYWPRSRAIATGLTLGLVSFASLVVWNAFQPAGTVATIERVVFTPTQITFSGNAGEPRFSPDGSTVALLQNRGMYGGELHRLAPDGGSMERVAADVGVFAWADGGDLVWSDASAGGTYAGVRAAEARSVSSETWQAMSADPSSGTVTRLEQTRTGTLVIRQALDGSGADTVLVTDGERVRDAAWSPDGAWLAASVTDVQGRASLRLFDARGSALGILLPQRVAAPRWSARGDAIYFVGEVERVEGLHVVPVDPRTGERAGPPSSVLPGLAIESFDVAADGAVVYSLLRRRANAWAIDLEGGVPEMRQATRGTAPVSSPALDPDGRRLAFARNGDLWMLDLDGDEETRLTELGTEIAGVRWSPDGRYVAFISESPAQRHLMVVAAEGGEPRRIRLANALPFDLEPVMTWSGDGSSVIYVGADAQGWPSVLSRVDLFSERDLDLLRGDSTDMAASFVGVAASPDGAEVVAADALGALRFVSLSDGTSRETWPEVPGRPLAWDADGRLALRSFLSPREVVTMAAEGGPSTLLATIPLECDAIALSRGGLKAACTVLESFERDVWIARPRRAR